MIIDLSKEPVDGMRPGDRFTVQDREYLVVGTYICPCEDFWGRPEEVRSIITESTNGREKWF